VAVTIVRTSKVGVKVGMVGKRVKVGGAGVSVGGGVAVRVGERVSVGAAGETAAREAGAWVAAGEQAEARKQRNVRARQQAFCTDLSMVIGCIAPG